MNSIINIVKIIKLKINVETKADVEEPASDELAILIDCFNVLFIGLGFLSQLFFTLMLIIFQFKNIFFYIYTIYSH